MDFPTNFCVITHDGGGTTVSAVHPSPAQEAYLKEQGSLIRYEEIDTNGGSWAGRKIPGTSHGTTKEATVDFTATQRQLAAAIAKARNDLKVTPMPCTRAMCMSEAFALLTNPAVPKETE